MYLFILYAAFTIIIVSTICAIYLPFLFFLRNKGVSGIRQLTYLALLCIVFLIVFATLIYAPPYLDPGQRILNLQLFDWVNGIGSIRQQTEVIPNILMYIPLGLLIPMAFSKMRKLPKVILIVFITTITIEFIQYFIGRSSDIDDVVENLLGGIIGYGVFILLNKVLIDKGLWLKLTGQQRETLS